MLLFGIVLGAVMGSVANALLYRLPRNLSWVKGNSMCPSCSHRLFTMDLLPIVSYVLLKGKCRYCRKPIGNRYLAVELFFAITFAVTFLVTSFSLWQIIGMLIILWTTTVIALMDWETKLVSEALVLIWGVGAVIYNYGQIDIQFLLAVLVAVVMIGGIWALSKGRAMGFGDVEIAVAMGLWLGWPKILVGLWGAFVLGGVVGVVMMSQRRNKLNLKSEIAFGPFLVIGSWLAYLFGDWVVRYFHV